MDSEASLRRFRPAQQCLCEAIIHLNADQLSNAIVQQRTRQAARAGTDFDDIGAVNRSACKSHTFQNVGIKQKVLAELFISRRAQKFRCFVISHGRRHIRFGYGS